MAVRRGGGRPGQGGTILSALTLRWWRVLSGGRFFTWWSALISFSAAVTALGAFSGVDMADQLLGAVLVSLVSWGVCVLLVLPAAWAERRLVRSWSRVLVVLMTVVVVSALRPPLNDLLLDGSSIATDASDWPVRIVTNTVSWLVLLSLTALAVDATVTASAVTRRLREALAALGGIDGYDDTMRRTQARVAAVVAELGQGADRLRQGVVDFDRVRAFSESVRAASHRLDAEVAEIVASGVSPQSLWSRLAPPPVGFVGVLYVLASIPYTSRVLAPVQLVVCAVALLAICVLSDLLLRVAARSRTEPARGVLIVVFAVVTGAVISLVSVPVLQGLSGLISLVAIPLLTVLAAVSEAAVRRSNSEQRWLTSALAAVRGPDAGQPRTAAEVLRAAAASLHGAVQGRCVVFAATLDDDVAGTEETEAFIAAVQRALDEVTSPPERGTDADPLGALIAVWSQAMRIDLDIDRAAAECLRDPAAACEVADIAREAFVNAVKHSAATRATVRVRVSGPSDGRRLRVEVASPGRLRVLAHLRRVGRLGSSARLSQQGREVVLEAVVPLDAR